jgi:succinyl-diaminopimelate desuccinylase
VTALTPPDTLVSSIVHLTAELVRIPSRAERGELTDVLQFLVGWVEDHDLDFEVLADGGGRDVALVVTVDSGRPGPAVVLNACLDTAGFGDEEAWSHPPTGAEVEGGWLYGRGAADSKVAAAMFAHLAAELTASPPSAGKLVVLFDVDEHSGRFGGAKAFLASDPGPLVGVMIGYPGNYGVVSGARGFWRATLTTFGTAAHSGSTKGVPQNAISKAARLVAAIEDIELPPATGDFPFGPSLTVTAVNGGEGYSQVADRCEVKVDVRLTPSFSGVDAATVVNGALHVLEAKWPTRRVTAVDVQESWPPYRLPDDSPLAGALRRGGERHLDRLVPATVCGPSNIGNYLAAHDIEATCGFGVTYRNIHGTDEAIELASIEPIYRAYRDAVLELLAD